jgi:hypothetical protein
MDALAPSPALLVLLLTIMVLGCLALIQRWLESRAGR